MPNKNANCNSGKSKQEATSADNAGRIIPALAVSAPAFSQNLPEITAKQNTYSYNLTGNRRPSLPEIPGWRSVNLMTRKIG